MKRIWNCLLIVWLAAASASAGETWASALRRMPLGCGAVELNRTNCVPLLLNAFQSNGVVKAFVFMPGATDELYFFRRVHARLTNADPSLLDAIVALTNQTFIRADFRPPLLLLHTTEDSLGEVATVKNAATARKLREKIVADRLVFNDAEWDAVRASVNPRLGVSLRPFADAPASWHFYRHNFAVCGATQWETLEAIARAGKTTFTVHWLTADFQQDRRTGAAPQLKHFPPP